MLARENGRVVMMGTTTRNRQRDIYELLQDYNLSDAQRKIVDAFGGKSDKDVVSLNDKSGTPRNICLIQGSDNGIGIKHSIFHHYGVRRNIFDADDVLLIPQIVANADRHQQGKRVTYNYNLNGNKYFFVTEIRNGLEDFINFYSTKKLRLKEQGSVTQGATPKIGGTTNNLNYGAKLQQNFETAKDKEQKKNCLLLHHSALIAGASVKAASSSNRLHWS